MYNTRNFLTEKSNHLIDWNRPGSLFFSNHRYSQRELLERGFVITSTAVMGFLAWNQSTAGGALPCALGASIGFMISHTITMYPLIYKRLKAQWACDELKTEINILLEEKLPKFVTVTHSVIDQVLHYSKSRSASETWGCRERLLTNLKHMLSDQSLSTEQLREILEHEDIIGMLEVNKFDNISSDVNASTQRF
ncbi:hypothetical protein [uncultured Legionella sp.]|uniref:hypothetical protein n=1 Tax=uncultured Legionella sp. TaxID=210934 RepID=UPI0026286252|nr:hypothetical protein [uncultured Legionella sp.]